MSEETTEGIEQIISCDSCGRPVSPAASRASRALDHVSPEAATAIELQFKVKTRELQLCAECFLAMYWMIVPHNPEAASV